MNRHISEHPCCQGGQHCKGAGHYKADLPSALKTLISAFYLIVGYDFLDSRKSLLLNFWGGQKGNNSDINRSKFSAILTHWLGWV